MISTIRKTERDGAGWLSLLFSLLVTGSLLCAGCSAPAPVPPADDVDQAITADSTAGQPVSEVAAATTPRLTLPDDFPAEVPLLPRRRIHCFNRRDNGSLSLTCSVPEDRRSAVAFYRQALADGGWEVTLDSMSGGMNSISARREDGSRLTVNVIVNREEQRTMIGLFHRPARD